MKKSLALIFLSVLATTSLTSCSGSSESHDSVKDKDGRTEKEAQVNESEVYVDGRLMKLIGGANPDDWSVEMTADESVKLIKKAQEDYRADPSKPVAVHVTVDGTSTEFVFEDPAVDLAGPWEKFAKESTKLKDLHDTIHHFAGTESHLDNELSSYTDRVPVDQCVKNIQDMASALATLDPALDNDYATHIGAYSCGEQESEIVFHISRKQAEFAKDMAAAYGKIDGPATYSEVYYDGTTGETTFTPDGGGEKFATLQEVVEKHADVAR